MCSTRQMEGRKTPQAGCFPGICPPSHALQVIRSQGSMRLRRRPCTRNITMGSASAWRVKMAQETARTPRSGSCTLTCCSRLISSCFRKYSRSVAVTTSSNDVIPPSGTIRFAYFSRRLHKRVHGLSRLEILLHFWVHGAAPLVYVPQPPRCASGSVSTKTLMSSSLRRSASCRSRSSTRIMGWGSTSTY